VTSKMQKTPAADRINQKEKGTAPKSANKKKTKNPEKPFSQQSPPDNYSFEVGM